MESVKNTLKQLGILLYLVNPKESSFETVEEVPDYVKEVTPLFVAVIVLEQVIRYSQGKYSLRLNDAISNASQGILMELFRIPTRGMEVILYSYLYCNYRLISLPWDSVWTWILCLLCTDFCFYWMHRITHQVSFLWAIHEPHHSSEDMNLTIPLRNHILLIGVHWLTYLPMALAIPPSLFFVHYQFNLLYQYWIHTEIIGKLGLIEWIFITPSHHRVHHGRNRRCIDKNFGGFLIIWDRMFGTFEEEGEKEIAYGLTHPLTTFNPLIIQTNHFQHVWRMFWSVEGFHNKMSALFKGPGWSPGKPWLGHLHEIPEAEPGTPKYDPVIPLWSKCYIFLHFLIVLVGYLEIGLHHSILSKFLLTSSSAFIVLSLIAIGMLLDGSSNSKWMEMIRCPTYFLLDKLIYDEVVAMGAVPLYTLYLCRVTYAVSFVMWLYISMQAMKIKLRVK